MSNPLIGFRKMQTTLILLQNKKSYFFEDVSIPNVQIDGVFRDHLIETNIVFKIVNRFFPFFKFLFYKNSWRKNIKQYSKIIIFDVAFRADLRILQYIRKNNKNVNIYVYYWNVVKNEKAFLLEKKVADSKNCAIYHYDQGDCKKFGLNFNSIMYSKTMKIPQNKIEYDCFFLGYSKGRDQELLAIYKLFSKSGITANFVVISNTKNYNELNYRSSRVEYDEYLDMLSKSRSILDIAQSGQEGLSLRVMEAIFFNKKLITTNKAVKETMFYDENNILIFSDTTTADEIKQFFNKPFKEYSQEIKDYYSIEQWVERFCN